MPLWTLVLGRGIARERLALRQIAGVVISVAGVAAVLADRSATSTALATGDLLILATALCGAIYNVLAKRSVARYGGVTVTFYAMLLGTLLLVPPLLAHSALGVRTWSRETIALLAFVGILGGALGFTLWTSALRRLSPTQVAVYINLNPLTATAIAATLLHERLSLRFVAGFMAVAAGVFIVNWTPAARRAASASP
jgi:drug/metabolite transporter (DMT)-like permease